MLQHYFWVEEFLLREEKGTAASRSREIFSIRVRDSSRRSSFIQDRGMGIQSRSCRMAAFFWVAEEHQAISTRRQESLIRPRRPQAQISRCLRRACSTRQP